MAGRPGKYESHVQPQLDAIRAWARNGLTVEQIAENLDVGISTFCRYQNDYEELREALNSNRDIADMHVENAMYKAATGFYYTEQVATPSGTVVEVTKYEKPNTTAQIFWLKNRKPREWRDRHETALTDADGGPLQVVFANMPRPENTP